MDRSILAISCHCRFFSIDELIKRDKEKTAVEEDTTTLNELKSSEWKEVYIKKTGTKDYRSYPEELSLLNPDFRQKLIIQPLKNTIKSLPLEIKIITTNNRVIHIYLSESYWGFRGESTEYIYKADLTNLFNRIMFLANLPAPLDFPPWIPHEIPIQAQNDLKLKFEHINEKSSFYLRQLASVINYLADTPHKTRYTFLTDNVYAGKVATEILTATQEMPYAKYIALCRALLLWNK